MSRTPHEAMSRHQRVVMALTCIGFFMVLLDVSIVNTALPSIQRSLHTSFSQLQWVVDAYTLAFAVLLLSAGSLADRFGRKRMFAFGLMVFTAGSLLCGLAQSSLQLDIARAIQGLGGAALAPSSLALLAASFPNPQQKVRAVALWSAISAIGLGVGPTLGGALVEGVGWRWVFFVNIPVGVLCLLAARRALHESTNPSARHVDGLGVVTSILWASGLTLGFIERGTHTWSEPLVYGPLSAAAVALVAFVVIEASVAEPMLPLGLFRSRTFATTAVVTFLFGTVLISTPFLAVQLLQNVDHHRAFAAGWRMLAFSAMFSIFSPVAGRMSHHWSFKAPIVTGTVLSTVGFLALTGVHVSTSYPDLAWRLALVGAGFGLMMSPLASAALAGVPHERSGLGSSVANATRQLGVVVGVAVLGAIVQSRAVTTARDGLRTARVPNADQIAARLGHGGAQVSSGLAGQRATALQRISSDAYISGLHVAFTISAIVTAGCAVLAAVLLHERRTAGRSPRRSDEQGPHVLATAHAHSDRA
jgi:EmrB/QacA subfamily drug resistance transporter